MKKALRETQTLRAGCIARRSQKNSSHHRPPSRGRRTVKI